MGSTRKLWMMLALTLVALAEPARLVLRWTGQGVLAEGQGWSELYRATRPLKPSDLSKDWSCYSRIGSRDLEVGEGVDYYYLARTTTGWMQAGPLSIPARKLPPLRHPRLLIDKQHYVLRVCDGSRVIKRYPVVMGRKARQRKLCYDNASTPEGRYRILGLQPQATYYRAYDLDYPNRVDRARHRVLGCREAIGGEIQIHGCGIGRNWTFGCVALRDSDMDELFAHAEIAAGIPCWIYGGELSLQDLQCDAEAGEYDPESLGRRQLALGLVPTCLRDRPSKDRGL
jgi:hypothetical protein